MTVQKRLLSVFGISFVILLVSIVTFLYFGKVKHENIQLEERLNKDYAADLALNLSSEYLYKFADDYTLWDELIENVTLNINEQWINNNIAPLLKTTQIKHIWIYNLDLEQKLYLKDESTEDLKEPLNPNKISEILSKEVSSDKHFSNFFLKYDNKIIEVMGATIHRSDDYKRQFEAEGYFFIARVLDGTTLQRLEVITNSKVQLVNDKINDVPDQDFQTVISKELKSWNDITIAHINFFSEDKVGKAEDKYNKIMLLVYISFMLIILFSVYYIINKNIAQPLTVITNCLDKECENPMEMINNREDEFGKIAILIEDFIAQKKEIEQQYDLISKQNAELEELNVTKDKFFSIIAHDLRNPFGIILQSTEFLANPNYQLSTEEITDFSKDLNETAKNLFNLLENLLTWARTQKGTIQFNPTELSAKDAIDTSYFVLESMATTKNITLKHEYENDLNCYVDRNMLLTILRNLTSNAIKFTAEGGIIKMSAKDSGDFIEFSVKDNGVGISEVNLAKLFRIDENLTTLGTANEKGTGLGLVLCKEFVEKNGGKIWVESQIGKGTTFKFTIPKFK